MSIVYGMDSFSTTLQQDAEKSFYLPQSPPAYRRRNWGGQDSKGFWKEGKRFKFNAVLRDFVPRWRYCSTEFPELHFKRINFFVWTNDPACK